MKASITVKIAAFIRDKDGKIIKRIRPRRANSLLKQFIQMLASQFNGAAIAMLDTTDVSRAPGFNGAVQLINAGANTTTYGIVVGTGETVVAMTDNKLVTQVVTNIAHGVCSAVAENPAAETWQVVISRTITNNTGSLLSIKEVGLYAMDGNYNYKFCIDRTLYPVDLSNGAGITLSYTVAVTL